MHSHSTLLGLSWAWQYSTCPRVCVPQVTPALIWARDAAGYTPIHWAYTSGNLTLGRQLMEMFRHECSLLESGEFIQAVGVSQTF